MAVFRRRSAAGMLVLLVLSGVSGSVVDAISVSAKPSKPSITVISAKVRSGKLDVAVTFNLASTHRASPILSTQVKVGTSSCTVAGRAKSCKLKNMKSQRYKVRARAKNKNGWGPWSASVSFSAQDGRVWRRNPTVPGGVSTTVPGGVSTTIPGGSITTGLKFDLKSAVGLGLKSSVSSTGVRSAAVGSNLQTIDSSGGVKDALVSGSAKINRFLIAPNDKVYVVFSSSTVVGERSCILAEVDRLTGGSVCVESDVDFRFTIPGQSKDKFSTGVTGLRNLVNDFQFDAEGAIYYMGIPGTRTTFPGLSCCYNYEGETSAVVRKYLDGKVTDFGIARLERGRASEPGHTGDFSSSVMIRNPIYNFLVMQTGDVLIDQGLEHLPAIDGSLGYCHFSRLDVWRKNGVRIGVRDLMSDMSNSTGCRSTYLASPYSSDTTVRASNAFGFLRAFDSSTVLAGSGQGLLFRIDVEDASASELPFLTIPGSSGVNGRASNVEAMCGVDVATHYDFRQWFCGGGTMWRGTWKAFSGSTYAIVGQDPGSPSLYGDPLWETAGVRYGAGVLMQVWPTVSPTALGFDAPLAILTRVETFLPIADSVVASGLTPDGGVQTVLYNTQTKSTEVLIPTSANLHPLKFSFNAGANKILFTAAGLMGVIDLTTKHLTTVSMNGQFEDVQAFTS